MPFDARPTRGTSYIFLVGDLAAILNSLEIDDQRSGYQRGYMDALRRVGAAVSVAYEAIPAGRLAIMPARTSYLQTSDRPAAWLLPDGR